MESHSNTFYNKKLSHFANNLRHNMTKAEACLWKYALSKSQMMGYSFRRQRPVLNYIADFMCQDLKLTIEVDGYTHLSNEIYQKDNAKDEALKKAGFTVLRFLDSDVLKNMPNVIRNIEAAILDLEKSTPASGGKGQINIRQLPTTSLPPNDMG